MRRHEIFQLVRAQGTCTVTELAGQLGVSNETIRRNIKHLAAEGLVKKIHGGITLPLLEQEPPIIKRMQRRVEEKRMIANSVAESIQNGDSLIIDTGSTTAFVAQALQAHSNLTVISNSSYIANLLASKNGNRVFLAGGELRPHDAAAFGPSVIRFIEQFEVNKAILSIAAIHATKGCMNYQLCEAEVSQAILRQSEYVILATDSSKFDRTSLTRVCGFDQIDLLVTDKPPPDALRLRLDNADVRIKLSQNRP